MEHYTVRTLENLVTNLTASPFNNYLYRLL